MNESVDLHIDEENVLTFEVKIEGDSSGAPVFRFICESDEMSYSFSGVPSDNCVEFTIPPMSGKISEGTYNSHLEVILENKLFIPIQLTTKFVPTTKVFAESVKIKSRPSKSEVTVSATPVLTSESKQKPSAKTKNASQALNKKPKPRPPAISTLRELYERRNRKR